MEIQEAAGANKYQYTFKNCSIRKHQIKIKRFSKLDIPIENFKVILLLQQKEFTSVYGIVEILSVIYQNLSNKYSLNFLRVNKRLSWHHLAFKCGKMNFQAYLSIQS